MMRASEEHSPSYGFNKNLAESFNHRWKQAGQVASKMRFLSAPWVRGQQRLSANEPFPFARNGPTRQFASSAAGICKRRTSMRCSRIFES